MKKNYRMMTNNSGEIREELQELIPPFEKRKRKDIKLMGREKERKSGNRMDSLFS